MLKIKDLIARYEENTVIGGVTFEFEDRKKYAITGASGIGKTTLINILVGLKKQDSGTIETSYENPSYIFQDARLFPWLTALENVELVCKDKKKAKELLHRLIDDKDIDKKSPSELSGGMRQRVAIARALSFDGDIVFMDEPFKGLDIETRKDTRKLVFDILKDKTVIMITHDIEDAEYCDVILRMEGSPVTALFIEKSDDMQI